MLRWIVKTSLRLRYLVILLACIMVLFGVFALRNTPIDVFPEFAPPIVEIQTESPGMSPTEVEELVTIPMEHVFQGVPGLEFLRSKSVEGLSSVKLVFKLGTNVLKARQLVQERFSLVKTIIPPFANPVMLKPLSATSRVMKIGITSNEYDLMDLSMIAYWKMRFRIMQVPGVANVAMWGERLKTLQAQVDPKKMVKNDVAFEDVLESVSDSLDFGLLPYTPAAKVRIDGFLETPNQRLDIVHVLPVMGPEEMAKLPLKKKKDLTIGDVAKAKWDHPLVIGDAVINDGPGLMLIVEKYPWANTLQVTHGVERVIEEMKPGLPNIEIDTAIFRPATFIEMSMSNLERALILGCVLVVIVLFAFLNEWRVALISSVAIPLSLFAAGLVLYSQNVIVNTMILAGFVIALGAVVDDAIVDIENIVRRLRESRAQKSKMPVDEIILEASLEVRNAIVFSSVIEILALVPVFFMGGLSGAFFEPLALAYIIAIIASTVVALTVTPASAMILLGGESVTLKESPLVAWLKRGYKNALTSIISKPVYAYSTVGIIVLLGIIVVPQLGQELLPSFKERDFLMHWLTKPGTSHPEMYRITVAASKELRSIPGVRNFGAHIGRAFWADEVVGVDFTENWISLDPKVPYDESVAKIQEVVDGYPGIYRDVQTYLKERIREVLAGSHEAIIIRIFGPKLETLQKLANDVKEAVSKVEGIVDLHVELLQMIPQVQIKVNLDKAEQYGLKPGDVHRAAAGILSGVEVSDIHRDGKVYDIMVWAVPEARHSMDNILQMLIDTEKGGRVKLEEIADVVIAPSPNAIKREGASRRIDVGANVKGRDLGSVVKDVEKALTKVEFPAGYYPELLGEYTERQATQKRLFVVGFLVLIAIYFMLYISLQSWALALISFLSLPAALVGGVLAAYLSSGVISLGSLVGFLTVMGIVARNGIMQINHFHHLELYEGEKFGTGLVIRGALERLSPILMTALVTGLAIVPLVIAGNIPGHEIEHPTAIVILGGLFTSTLLNLFVIPSLYLRYGENTASLQQKSDDLI